MDHACVLGSAGFSRHVTSQFPLLQGQAGHSRRLSEYVPMLAGRHAKLRQLASYRGPAYGRSPEVTQYLLTAIMITVQARSQQRHGLGTSSSPQ